MKKTILATTIVACFMTTAVSAQQFYMEAAKSKGLKNSIRVVPDLPTQSNGSNGLPEEPEVPTLPEQDPLPDQWLSYIQSHGDLLDITDLNDWSLSRDAYNNQGIARVSGTSVTDSSVPQGRLGVTDIFRFFLEGTMITHIDFMQGVKSMQWNFIVVNGQLQSVLGLSDLNPDQSGVMFQFQNNQLTNLDGMGHITAVKMLNVTNNKLTNLDGLSSLRTVTQSASLNISNNPTLTDISGLANLTFDPNGYYDYGGMQVDNPTQYTTKVPLGSNFCNSLASFDINGYNYPVRFNYSTKVAVSDICE